MARREQRRSRGDGTAYQTKDGRWRAEIVVGRKPDGKPIRKVLYATTEVQANAKRRAAAAAAARGELIGGRAPTLEEWIEHWISTAPPSKIRERTKAGYRSYIRTWIHGRKIAKKRLDKITPEELLDVYAEMRDAGRSETTISQMHRILSRAFTVAVQRGRITMSPAKRIDAPTPGRFSPDILTVEDARRLIQAAESDTKNGARWMFALALGPRQGERLALARDRVDFATHKITIDRELYRLAWKHGCTERPCQRKRGADCPNRHGGGLFIGDPKSDAGLRALVMPPQLENALKQHLRRQDSIRAEEGDAWSGFTSANGEQLELVFCQRNGRAIDPRADHATWKAFLETAGVPEVRLHDARHTAATVLLLMGIDGRVVMDILGWSQATMLKRYQHVLDEMKHDAATKVGQALWTSAGETEPTPPAAVVDMGDYRRKRARQ